MGRSICHKCKKLLKALKHFGAPIANLSVEELVIPGLVYVFGIPPVRVDILNRVSGGKFEARCLTVDVRFKLFEVK